jgi:phospholipid/cholesterol/gamma-HCH transport system ATP-binding protein
MVIEAEELAKSYQGRVVLSDVSFTVDSGETLVIMGRSGSGKTTCLRILMGQVLPDRGRVALFGRDLAGLSRRELAGVRRRFGVVFQSGALLNSLSVKENVALPLRELTALDREVVSLMVKLRLEKVGLRDYADYMPDELSGGMKKRVGIARALIMDPEILFYDEPTAGLDPVMTAVINQLIMDIAKGLGVASVVVTHDMESAFRVADRMIMLFEGRVVAEGTPEEVRRSRDPILRQFVDGDHEGPVSYTGSSTSLSDDLLGS